MDCNGYFVEVDIDVIIKEKCKDPEFAKCFEKANERYSKNNTGKKRYKSMDRARMMKK